MDDVSASDMVMTRGAEDEGEGTMMFSRFLASRIWLIMSFE